MRMTHLFCRLDKNYILYLRYLLVCSKDVSSPRINLNKFELVASRDGDLWNVFHV